MTTKPNAQSKLEQFIQAQELFTIDQNKFSLDDIIEAKAPIKILSIDGLTLLQNRLRSNETNVSNQLLQKESTPHRDLYLKALLEKIKMARKAFIVLPIEE
jgi:hypothetical protein